MESRKQRKINVNELQEKMKVFDLWSINDEGLLYLLFMFLCHSNRFFDVQYSSRRIQREFNSGTWNFIWYIKQVIHVHANTRCLVRLKIKMRNKKKISEASEIGRFHKHVRISRKSLSFHFSPILYSRRNNGSK